MVTVEDEETHRSHFAARADSPRPYERYLASFDNIRKVQRYIKSQALSHGVPVVPNYGLDRTLGAIIDLVMDSASERLGESAAPAPEPSVIPTMHEVEGANR